MINSVPLQVSATDRSVTESNRGPGAVVSSARVQSRAMPWPRMNWWLGGGFNGDDTTSRIDPNAKVILTSIVLG